MDLARMRAGSCPPAPRRSSPLFQQSEAGHVNAAMQDSSLTEEYRGRPAHASNVIPRGFKEITFVVGADGTP